MSTMFQDAEVERHPTVAVIGKVKEVKKPERRDDGSYYVAVSLESDNPAPRQNLTAFLGFREEWLAPGFSPKTIEDKQDLRTYHSSIATAARSKGLPVLKALAGKGLPLVAEKTQIMMENGGFDPSEFHAILKEAGEGQEVIFEVKQKFQYIPPDETGTGEPEFIATDDFKVGQFYPATDDSLKSLTKRAVASREKAEKVGDEPRFKVGWEELDGDVPF